MFNQKVLWYNFTHIIFIGSDTMLYGVITMDLVNSRNLKERVEFQDKLIKYIDIVNSNNSNIIVTKGAITLGDEWQFIINRPEFCYDLVHEFQRLLWREEISFYAGIGIGTLTTKIYEDIRSMDGPCFNLARQSIEIAKKSKPKVAESLISSKNNRIYIKFSNSYEESIKYNLAYREAALDETNFTENTELIISAVNSLIENTEILKSKMTEKQRKVYCDYIRYGSYKKLIEEGRYSETLGSISQKINGAEFFTIMKNHKLITQMLSYCCRR